MRLMSPRGRAGPVRRRASHGLTISVSPQLIDYAKRGDADEAAMRMADFWLTVSSPAQRSLRGKRRGPPREQARCPGGQDMASGTESSGLGACPAAV